MGNPSLEVNLGPLSLANPVLAASGTFGFGEEYSHFYPLSRLGGVVTKAITASARAGNPPPRLAETPAGLLNSIGLQNPGVEGALAGPLPWLRRQGTAVVANVAAYSLEEYESVTRRLDQSGLLDAVELNVSCPNVAGGGLAFGTDCGLLQEVVAAARGATRLPLLVKLSPNVADLVPLSRAAAAGGADALSLINTLTGMAVDVATRKPILGNRVGGLSGPAIKPVALRMVWEVYQETDLPLVGMGGIVSAQDALEFILVGAAAVAVGTASFVDPLAPVRILEGLEQYAKDEGLESLAELTGALEV